MRKHSAEPHRESFSRKDQVQDTTVIGKHVAYHHAPDLFNVVVGLL